MSDTSAEPLSIETIRARINRDLAESEKLRSESLKLAAEQQKLIAEQQKFTAEQLKLAAEASKLSRDRGLAPWLAIVGLIGGLLAIANFLLRFLPGH